MKIIFEHNKCISCGACAVVCPKHWEIDVDGKTKLLDSKTNPETKNYEKEVEKIDCLQETADGCPSQCIHILKT